MEQGNNMLSLNLWDHFEILFNRAVVATDTCLSTLEPPRLRSSRQGGSPLVTESNAYEPYVHTHRWAKTGLQKHVDSRDCHNTIYNRLSTTALTFQVLEKIICLGSMWHRAICVNLIFCDQNQPRNLPCNFHEWPHNSCIPKCHNKVLLYLNNVSNMWPVKFYFSLHFIKRKLSLKCSSVWLPIPGIYYNWAKRATFL